MALITVNNLDVAVQNNILSTLAQIKQSGIVNQPLVIPYTAASVIINFYADAARTILVLSDRSTSPTGSFTIVGTNTNYIPSDTGLNSATALSTTLNQPLYYYTATFSDATVIQNTYNNAANLLFQQVMVGTTSKPEFVLGVNAAILVPQKQELINKGWDEDISYLVQPYDIYLQLMIINWSGMTDTIRVQTGMATANVMRNALYADRYRDSNCGTISPDLNGTVVGNFRLLPSVDALQGCMSLKCVSRVSSTTY